MRALCLILLVGCTSTRQLASPADPRLRDGGHGRGFVAKTTEPWRERIDPNTVLRLRNADGGWSKALQGRDLHVDDRGIWIESSPIAFTRFADQIELRGVPDGVLAALDDTRPRGGELQQVGDAWIMGGALRPWLEALVRTVADHPDLGMRLGSVRVHTPEQGWRAPLNNSRLIDALFLVSTTKLGWRWEDIAAIKVQNLSGGKTLAAIAATGALAVVIAPIALVAGGLKGMKNYDGPPAGRSRSGGGSVLDGEAIEVAARVIDDAFDPQRVHARATFAPTLATSESIHARPLFTTGEQVRSVLRPTLSLDAGGATAGDVYGTGIVARVRLGEVFEIGGGAREVFSKDARGWTRSTTHVFQLGLHLPIDAGFRIAVPLGFEASGGGAIAHDIRFPWGLRYTSASGRYFVTASPATPGWMRTTDQRTGRWSLNTSAELGVSF